MTGTKPQPLRFNWILVVALCLLCIAGCLRFSALGNLPGINADEADMGVRIEQMLHGQPYSLRSRTGEFFNPVFIACQVVLLRFFPPDFYLLRLPAALFAALGIGILIYTYARFFADWNMALVLGAYVACFPLHLIFSRLAWDPTFLLFWVPILLYLSLRIITSPRRRDFLLIGVCIFLAAWTHGTAIIFILAMLAALLWMRRDDLARHLAKHLPKPLALFVPQHGTILFCACALLAAIVIGVAQWVLLGTIRVIADLTPVMTLLVLFHPGSVVLHLRLLGDMLTSYRALSYAAGFPNSPALAAMGWIGELLLVFCWFRLARARNPADRFLAYLLVTYFLLILLMAGLLHLNIPASQRYLAPMMVLLPIIVVRGFPRPVFLLILCAVMLVEYWFCFEQPALQCSYPGNTEFTLRSGLREPKAEAAELILRLSSGTKKMPVVYTDLYWLQKPLQFLLFGCADIRDDWPEAQDIHAGDFVAAYAGERFADSIAAALTVSNRHFQLYTISNQLNIPEVVVLQIVK